MSPVKQILGPFDSDVPGWEGKFLALHEDNTLSQMDIGTDESGPAVKFVPVKVY